MKKARSRVGGLPEALRIVREAKSKRGVEQTRYNMLTSCEGMLRKMVG